MNARGPVTGAGRGLRIGRRLVLVVSLVVAAAGGSASQPTPARAGTEIGPCVPLGDGFFLPRSWCPVNVLRSHIYPCDDGYDNDRDGTADYGGNSEYSADPGCTSATDSSELGDAACDNGIDDDGDGGVDRDAWDQDYGCSSPTDESEYGAGQCDDGIDNDGDGLVDHRPDGSGDPQCYGIWSSESR